MSDSFVGIFGMVYGPADASVWRQDLMTSCRGCRGCRARADITGPGLTVTRGSSLQPGDCGLVGQEGRGDLHRDDMAIEVVLQMLLLVRVWGIRGSG